MRHDRRPARGATLVPLACLSSLLFLAGCPSVPKPEPVLVPEIVAEAPPPPPKPPEPPKQYLVVTAKSKVNLRSGPGPKEKLVGSAKRGEKLLLVADKGDWYEVRLADEKPAFVSAQFVRKDEPCLPDMDRPEVLTAPVMDLSEGDVHGLVVMKIKVDAKGNVAGVTVVSNGTGDAALEKKAVDEARGMRFSPLVRKCKAVPFVYQFTRMF